MHLCDQYLFAIVRLGDIKFVDILFEKGVHTVVEARFVATDSYGHSPLYIAAKRGHLEMCRYLLKKDAALDDTKRLINRRDVNGFTPLTICAYLGNETMCRLLLQFGAHLLNVDKLATLRFIMLLCKAISKCATCYQKNL